MKVISKGCQRVQCQRCGSLLEYEWNDIYPFDEDSAEPSYAVLCPECGNMIDVPNVIKSSLQTSQYTYPEISADTLYPSLVFGGDFFDRGGLCVSDVATTNATTAK